jgi:hypothetical protein
MPSAVVALEKKITAKAHGPFERAVAIQNFLTSPPFTYSTDAAPADNKDALARFLLITHRGFCQQFAASMAILARMAGIPSRVAVGFTHGTLQADRKTWLVTTHDAHAWPELFISGFGWLAFEPTPRGDGQTLPPAFTQPAGGSEPSDVGPKSSPSAKPSTPALTGAARKQAQQDGGGVDLARPAAASVRRPSSSSWWPLVIALLAAMAIAPVTLRLASRALRLRAAYTGDTTAVWHELRASVIDAGRDWRDGLSPRAAARLIEVQRALSPAARSALDRVVAVEERTRYAPPTTDGPDLHALWHASTLVRRDMLAALPIRARLVAVVWPRSGVRMLAAVVRAVATALNVLDLVFARIRQWLTRRLPRPA